MMKNKNKTEIKQTQDAITMAKAEIAEWQKFLKLAQARLKKLLK